MNINDLKQFIIDRGYPFNMINFSHEYPNEAYCIREAKKGKWEVYYSEKGQKSGLVSFENETEACEYLKEIICNS